MRLVFTTDGLDRELIVHVAATHDPTVAELAAALTDQPLPTGGGLLIDQRFAAAHEPLATAGLTEGCTVRIADRAPEPEPPPAATLAVTAGLEAGRRFALMPGAHVVGRGDAAVALHTPTVSRHHCNLDVSPTGAVTVRDAGSRNGTRTAGGWIAAGHRLDTDGPIEIGALHLAIEEPAADAPSTIPAELARRLAPGPVAPFNRPPRPAPPVPPAPLQPPAAAPPASPRPRFAVLALLGPLVLGAAAAIFFNPLMALFALLSPFMMLTSWLEARRRGRSDQRKARRAFRDALAAFTTAVETAAVDELCRRRSALPHLAEVVRRAEAPSVRLWERRLTDPDVLILHAGTGDVPWQPPIDGGDPAPEVAAVLAGRRLVRCPVALDLSPGRVVGIVGPRGAALAVARSLVCQTAVHHGPADVRICAAADIEVAEDWSWMQWLPHTRDPDGDETTRLIAIGRDGTTALEPTLDLAEARSTPALLTVVDGEEVLTGRSSLARALLRKGSGIVVATTVDRLPAVCTTVIDITDRDGTARLVEPRAGSLLDDVLIAGMDEPTACACARALARWDDPELPLAGGGLPTHITLLEALGMPRPAASEITERWRRSAASGSIAAPVGADDEGPVCIDLVADGPHALIGGTTGSGKSELLRSMVVSMAATADPEHLTFLLVDYKGGSAFDSCARLPHTVGLVTDLDEHLGARALRCLEAEIRGRERALRDAGAPDVRGYEAARGLDPGLGPLPRLVVVIDEFATLAAELPDFMAALVSVAQRGRSLGVHLVLATQRPAGAVNDSIRTNTNLRIALRVVDRADSIDVIGGPEAASIGRGSPGRAYARLGPGELVPFQAATCTSSALAGETAPVVVLAAHAPSTPASEARPADASALDALVDAIGEAFVLSGASAPPRPWPDPLPDVLLGVDVADARGVVLGLADDPDNQCQLPFAWDPDRGNLLVYGVAGSGTTTAMAAAALGFARRRTADELHVYALDFGAGALAPLGALPHTVAVIGAVERERQIRLVRLLRAELDRRRDGGGGPALLILVDNMGALAAELGNAAGVLHLEALQRVAIDGPAVGIHMVITADRGASISHAIASTCTQRLVLRLGDPVDAAGLGIKAKLVGALPPGRGWWAESGLAVQVALPHAAGLHAAIDVVRRATAPPAAPPRPIEVLPEAVSCADLARATHASSNVWLLPVGVGDHELAPVGLELEPSDHALVTGPARSGKTTVLAVLGHVAAGAGVDVFALAGQRSSLSRSGPWQPAVPSQLDELGARIDPWLLLIDDVELVEDDGSLRALLARPALTGHVVGAGRPDRIRAAYGSWIHELRESRRGIALRPNVDVDGDLWQTPLPRRLIAPMGPGRGFIVRDGEAELFQAARP